MIEHPVILHRPQGLHEHFQAEADQHLLPKEEAA